MAATRGVSHSPRGMRFTPAADHTGALRHARCEHFADAEHIARTIAD